MLPGQVGVQLLMGGRVSGARSNVIYRLGSLTGPIQMSDLRPVVAIDHERRRNHFGARWVQEPEQKETVRRDGTGSGHWQTTDAGLG
jgi:hypothetical protein